MSRYTSFAAGVATAGSVMVAAAALVVPALGDETAQAQPQWAKGGGPPGLSGDLTESGGPCGYCFTCCRCRGRWASRTGGVGGLEGAAGAVKLHARAEGLGRFGSNHSHRADRRTRRASVP